MEERKIAIKLNGIAKKYRLGAIGGRTLQDDIQSWWANLRGKEDPNSIIGQNARLVGKSFMALDGIDLTIYQGEAVGIIGVNGAGKSTLLKLISQITAPSKGEIDIYGRVTSMLEVGTGFNSEMTGRENVYMNGAILGMTKNEITERMEDIIEFSEIREFIDTPVKRYSSGMFVKLAFSVAAHLKSDIMIMDEVLAVGDMAFQKKCLDKMKDAANTQGKTVLYVSHNLGTIRKLCDRCIVLNEGKIIFDGDVDKAISIYMDNSIGNNDVDMDLSNKTHINGNAEAGVVMKHLQLVNKDVPVYENGEDVKLRLVINANEQRRDLIFRMTLRTDDDYGIGTAWSEEFGCTHKGENVFDMTFPTKGIAQGIFYVSIGICCKDELGRYVSLDHITRAFKIEVQGIPIWNTRAFGYMELDDIKAEAYGVEKNR